MEFIGALVVGFLASMVSAISTGGALINIPGLIFLGFNPVTAIATSRLSAIAGSLSALYRYHKSKQILWHILPTLLVISVIGGLIGPKLLMQIDAATLEPTIGIILLLMLPVLFINNKFGVTTKSVTPRYKVLSWAILLLIMAFSTMFGIGGGTFLLYALIYFFGMTLTQANATGQAMWLFGTMSAFVSYASQGVVDYSLAIPLVIGSIIGGYTGAHIAIKKGSSWVKWLLAIVIVLSSIKLIIF